MEYGLDESLRVIMSCRRKISRVVYVFVVMRVLVADGRNLATSKFGYVNIDSSSWTPLATHTNEYSLKHVFSFMFQILIFLQKHW